MRDVTKIHFGLVIYHAAIFIAFIILSRQWRDNTYDITFRSDFQFNFGLLVAVSVNAAILCLHHAAQAGNDRSFFIFTNLHVIRILGENASLTVMSLIVQYTSGVSDLLIGIAVILLWIWRGETYTSYEQGHEAFRTRFGATVFAALIPFVAFVATASDASLYRSMIFGFFVAHVICDSLVAWFGNGKETDNQIRLAHLIVDFAFSAMITYTSLVMVYNYSD
jgi:hypothetical protein